MQTSGPRGGAGRRRDEGGGEYAPACRPGVGRDAPVALLAGLGLPALGALLFLAVAALAVSCWVIASGERTDRVSQMMLARRGHAGGPAPGAAAPPVPASRPTAAPDAQGGRRAADVR